MKTSEYPHYKCSFQEFNKAQEAVIPYLDKNVNLIVCFKTAVGKTALAECAFGYHLNTKGVEKIPHPIKERSKVIYVSPYKSISSERHKSWLKDEQFSSCGILLRTGDVHTLPEEYEENRIIIMTSESLDSKIRHEVSNKGWISKVRCVVFDEAHLLGQKRRGSSMEVAIMNLSRLNPEIRFILLSATMSNAKKVAQWIKSLNNKQTKCISSDWRPVKIRFNYYSFEDVGYKSEKNKIAKAIEVIGDKIFGEKIILFVHSKKTGAEIAKTLRRKGVACAFHNASLSLAMREKIENSFNDPYSGLDIMVSTSTLSSGVNIG